MSTTLAKHLRLRAIYPRPLVLYKHLLRQSKMFFDDATQYYFIKTIRYEFRKNRHLTSRYDIDGCLGYAFTHLKRLVRANAGHKADSISILGLTYGFSGPVVSLRNKYRAGKQFLALTRSSEGIPFRPLTWGVEANHTAYPLHPRVIAALDANPEPFMKQLLQYTSTLTRDQRRMYRQWAELSWLPREPVILHGRHEWNMDDFVKKRVEVGIDEEPMTVTTTRTPERNVIFGADAHILPDYFPVGKKALKNPAHTLPIPALSFAP